MAEYVCREWVDEVFINLPKKMPLPQELMDSFIDMGVTVHVKLIEMGRLKGQVQHVERMGTYTVLTSSINMALAPGVLQTRHGHCRRNRGLYIDWLRI